MNKQQQQAYGFGHGHGDSPYCCFHPRELVVGVCAHCLKDRLLLLLAAKDANPHHPALLRRRSRSRATSISSLPKVFALGSSFLQRLDSRHYSHRPDAADADAAAAAVANDNYSDDTTSVASLDDSFISIKFEDNGKATWDSQNQKQKQNQQATAGPPPAPVRSSSSSTVVVAEHAKRGGVGVTRWRKQVVGRLLQLARWKRSAAKAGGSAAACHAHAHVGLDGKKPAVERSKARGRAGWIRSLTRRRAAAAAHGDRAWS